MQVKKKTGSGVGSKAGELFV